MLIHPSSAATANQFAANLRQQLAARADPARSAPMAAYMKQRFVFFGIPTPARRAAVKAQVASLGRTPEADWLLAVAEALWVFEERECQYVAVDLLVKFAAHFEARHEPQLAALVQAKAWWDSVDLIAAHVYGSLCRRAPALRARVDGYATRGPVAAPCSDPASAELRGRDGAGASECNPQHESGTPGFFHPQGNGLGAAPVCTSRCGLGTRLAAGARGLCVGPDPARGAQTSVTPYSIFKSLRSRKRAADSVNTRQGDVDKERIYLEME
jgi:hypothetical protein